MLAYLAEEWKLTALQDSEAGRYNSVAMKYAGATRLGSADFQELLSAAKRLSQVSAELVRRHSELDPAPDAALETYSAWQACYLAYEEWASAVVFSYEPHEVNTRAEAKRLQELLNAVELRMQEARAVTDVLRRRCQD